jgi:hypothetical protein
MVVTPAEHPASRRTNGPAKTCRKHIARVVMNFRGPTSASNVSAKG